MTQQHFVLSTIAYITISQIYTLGWSSHQKRFWVWYQLLPWTSKPYIIMTTYNLKMKVEKTCRMSDVQRTISNI